MKTFPSSNSLSVSVSLYRTLLVAYPKKFREHYETQMVQVFRDSFREAYLQNGKLGVIDLWLHTFFDLVFTALIERFSERSQIMFSPKVIMWGGITSAFGGLLWLLPTEQGGDITFSMGLLLMLGGLASLHLRHGKQAGALGWAGFVLGMLGTGPVPASVLWQTFTGNPLLNPHSSLGLLFGLGLGIGSILIGLRTLQAKILPRSSGILSFVIGASQIGLAISVWLAYSTTSDPWNPMIIPARAIVYFGFSIGILWLALGAIIAGDAAGLQTSNHPSASV